MRADNYGFISTVGKVLDFTASYGDVILAHLLDGANVTLTIERKGVELIINAKYVKDGQTYTYGGTLDNVVPATGTIGTFLTVDASYLTNINCIVN